MKETLTFIQPRDSGRLIVGVGQVSIVAETDFAPTSVVAGFVDTDVVTNFPTCVPPLNDAVQAEIYVSPDGTKFGVIVTWNITSVTREIEWMAF